MRLSRKEFLESSLALAGLAVGFGVLGCSDDDDPPGGMVYPGRRRQMA